MHGDARAALIVHKPILVRAQFFVAILVGAFEDAKGWEQDEKKRYESPNRKASKAETSLEFMRRTCFDQSAIYRDYEGRRRSTYALVQQLEINMRHMDAERLSEILGKAMWEKVHAHRYELPEFPAS